MPYRDSQVPDVPVFAKSSKLGLQKVRAPWNQSKGIFLQQSNLLKIRNLPEKSKMCQGS